MFPILAENPYRPPLTIGKEAFSIDGFLPAAVDLLALQGFHLKRNVAQGSTAFRFAAARGRIEFIGRPVHLEEHYLFGEFERLSPAALCRFSDDCRDYVDLRPAHASLWQIMLKRVRLVFAVAIVAGAEEATIAAVRESLPAAKRDACVPVLYDAAGGRTYHFQSAEQTSDPWSRAVERAIAKRLWRAPDSRAPS